MSALRRADVAVDVGARRLLLVADVCLMPFLDRASPSDIVVASACDLKRPVPAHGPVALPLDAHTPILFIELQHFTDAEARIRLIRRDDTRPDWKQLMVLQ